MIANDRRRSQRELFPYRKDRRIYRRRSQTIAEPTVAIHSVQRKCQSTRAFCSRENQSKQHGGHRGGNFAASKFISFSPKTTTTLALKPKETSVLDSKNIHEETR